MSKHTNIVREQLLESIRGKAFCIVLTFVRMTVFLMAVVMVMTKLMHEDMEEHKCPGLGFSESAKNVIFFDVM